MKCIFPFIFEQSQTEFCKGNSWRNRCLSYRCAVVLIRIEYSALTLPEATRKCLFNVSCRLALSGTKDRKKLLGYYNLYQLSI